MASIADTPTVFAVEDDRTVDLRTLGLIFRRRLAVFLAVVAVVVALALVFIALLPDRYSATSRVVIERRTMDVTDSEQVLSDMPSDSAAVDTEVQRLGSRTLAAIVVKQLKLETDPVMHADANSGLFAKLRGVDEEPLTETEAVSELLTNLDISRRGLTYVIDITYNSGDPVFAAKVANTVAIEYLNQQRNAKLAASSAAEKYLSSQRAALNEEVRSKEAAATNLRARAGLPTNERLSSFDDQQIADISTQVIQAESEVADKQARLSAAQAARSNAGALPEVLASQVVRDLRSQRATIASKLADLQTRYGAQYPEVAATRGQLGEIDAEISRETMRIISGLTADVNAAQRKLSVLRGALGATRSRSVANAQTGVAVSAYDRDAQVSKDLYDTFSRRTKEAASSSDLATPDASIGSQAAVPLKPSAPNRLLLAGASGIVAIILGILAVIIAELLDIKLSNGQQIRRHLGLSRIASIPQAEADNKDAVALSIADAPMSRYAESYRSLASTFVTRAAGAKGRVVMVTSALPHEGKTTSASSLAMSLAGSGRRVLIVDCDLRRPRLMDALGGERPSVGLADILLDGAPVKSGITRDARDKLDILPIRERRRGMDAMEDNRFAQMIQSLKPLYDFIILDTPPVLATSEARLLAPIADDVVLVTRWRRTSRFAARAAVDALRAIGAPLVGVVLNGVNLKTQSLYSDDDSLAYYGAYSKYYD